MMQKAPCPACGELNYTTSPACWKCGASMRAAPPKAPEPPVPPEPSIAPVEPAPAPKAPAAPDPVPPPTPLSPLTPGPQEAIPQLPDSQPAAQPPTSAPKPAELEASALREKDFVTPPVDVEETPHGVGEWLAYIWAAVVALGQAFKQSLNDYDTRRGHKSGTISSYGCVVAAVIILIVVAVMAKLLPFMLANVGR